ncbi:hypothetical protein [Mucilaginibacter sp. AK015]|uniref:hypothetical protein n=1 Tax=Mucilaginibacter sp. AK015 TaxID=2723072 RepID=UPI001607B38C|nr:hypothetical protein [Mucilaginibacter sp. AK015]MBB5396904.1 hypothetical protein [Mucilaginibacter sp. AK015]
MEVNEYIQTLPEERQAAVLALHSLILSNDHSVKAKLSPMMGKIMIRYDQGETFKYALAGENKQLTLHCMPIYCNTRFKDKYLALLTGVKVQKGCINFVGKGPLPFKVLADLIAECAAVDMPSITAGQKEHRK